MYTKNPSTNIYEGYAYQSDLDKVEKKLNEIETKGGTSAGVLNKANAAKNDAVAVLQSAQTSADEVLNLQDAVETASAKLATALTDANTLSTTATRVYNTVTNEAKPVVDECVAHTEAIQEKASLFIDSYVTMTERVADITQLNEVGNLAHISNEEKYPYSHITTLNDFQTSFSFPETVTGNFMSLTELPTSPTSITKYKTNTVKEWKSNLPSFTIAANSASPFSSGNKTELTSFSGQLPNLVIGNYLFNNCIKLTSFSVNLPSLESARYMFQNCKSQNLQISTTYIPRLKDGTSMFQNCSAIVDFEVDLPSLEDGTNMFCNCNALVSGPTFLPRLKNGSSMFFSTKLTRLDLSLPSLTNGENMFCECANFEHGPVFLPNLDYGRDMFWHTPLISCARNLEKLTDGYSMFSGCSSFVDGPLILSSLQVGDYMFEQCRLSAESLKGIMDTIPTVTISPAHTIRIGCLGDDSEKSCLVREPGSTLYTIAPEELVESIKTAKNEKHWNLEVEFFDRVGEAQQIPHENITNYTEIFG